MTVRAAKNQSGGDPVLSVRLQEIRSAHLVSVRTVAGRWEQGIRGLLGVTGVVGLIGAPLAIGNLDGRSRLAVSLLLATVLVTAGVGLTLTMVAAYGSVRVVPVPTSLLELQTLSHTVAERGRRQLLWGRRLAFVALVLFAVAVVFAWLRPSGTVTLLKVTTNDGVTYCGPSLDAPDGTLALYSSIEGRVEILTTELASVSAVRSCGE